MGKHTQDEAAAKRGTTKAGEPRTLAEIRRALGVTQVQAAAAAGMSQVGWSAAERRQDQKVSTLARLARAVGGELEVAIVVDGVRHVVRWDAP